MQINGKKKQEEIGEREEKGRQRSFNCFLNYRFTETEILDWSAACQSVNKSFQCQRNNDGCSKGSTVVSSLLKCRPFVGFSMTFSLNSEGECNDRQTLLEARFSPRSRTTFSFEIVISDGE